MKAGAEKLFADGHKALAVSCDVSDGAQVAAMVDRTVAELARVDAAFNNASVMACIASTADSSRENGVTIMLAEALRPDGIAVNSMCPRWVRTDRGGPSAIRSVEEGADTSVWLADEAPHEMKGKFFCDRQEIP